MPTTTRTQSQRTFTSAMDPNDQNNSTWQSKGQGHSYGTRREDRQEGGYVITEGEIYWNI